MAFFKSFQTNLPSVNISSILDSVTSRVDDLANAVSDVTYAVSDQLTEQVTTIINKVQEDEDGENSGGQESAQASVQQEGKAGSKSIWQMPRDTDTSNTGTKNNQASDTTEAEHASSQLEWEWRDGCWRVKKTEAQIAEEEKKKKEEQEQQERREQRRRERREKQLEKESKKKQEESPEEGEEEGEEITEDSGQDRRDSRKQSAPQQSSEETPLSPGHETERRSSKQKEQKDDGEEEEEVEDDPEREADNEEEAELSRSSSKTKKKKSDKKKGEGAKEGSKKPEKASDVEKKKEKGNKSKKKKKGSQEGALSDSEEDKGPQAMPQQNSASAWSSKQPTEQGGSSSEASSERANCIQRIQKDSSLVELQPPPYQDEGSRARVSSRGSRSERGVRRVSSPQHCDSEATEASEDQDTESYLNKGCEEDIPSDSTAVVGPEDSSGPQLPTAYEPEPLAQYGTLDVAFEYDSGQQWLAVTVTAATDIPALKQTGNISWQVHLVLLPTKKQRAKTGVQKGPCPVFTETFKFSKVEQDALGDYAVRFRLYSIRRMKKEKVLGEKVFYLTKLNLQGKIALPVTLEPGSELTGCGSLVSVSRSAGALSYRSTEDTSVPEILLGLIYNSATGQLAAEVIQGSHFKTAASDKAVNTYVKLSMLDSKGKEMSKRKTAVCRGHPNPTYKETFVFQVALFQLSEVSLVLSVFCRRSSMRPRERLGWVSLGLNSTSEEQQAHWTEMKEAEGQQVCHWHTLTDT
ncbi:synaptotagmin-14-like [Parambassis ranga]|uniref:Synaptotagmin-14-like n=1 Tax=Parambassis ranga TaxID=210632 RepID=A0A6P7HN03_9TELE|nr:synaptotagmin-14-like [Parambassis ranga]